MNKKLLVAGGLVVAGLGYLALQPKGDIPNTVTEPQPKQAKVADDQIQPAPADLNQPKSPESVSPKPLAAAADPTPQDQDTETKLTQTLQADSELAKLAVIHSVQCAGGKCTIEMEAKEDEGNIQMPMFEFIRKHPEYGQNYQFYAREDNPKVTQFTISKE